MGRFFCLQFVRYCSRGIIIFRYCSRDLCGLETSCEQSKLIATVTREQREIMMDEFGYTVSRLCRNPAWPHGRTKTYKLMAAGLLKAKKSDKQTIITPEAVREYLANLPDYRAREARG